VFQFNLQEIISQKYLALGFTQGFLFSRRRQACPELAEGTTQSPMRHNPNFIIQCSLFNIRYLLLSLRAQRGNLKYI